MRKRKLLTFAVVLMIVIVVGNAAYMTDRVEISVDVCSGKMRKQSICCGIVLSDDVEDTEFSIAAGKAGLQQCTSVWHVDTTRYRWRPLHENGRYHGALSDLHSLVMGWDLQDSPTSERLRDAKRAVEFLRQGRRFKVDFANPEHLRPVER